jgi:hypothetical protein
MKYLALGATLIALIVIVMIVLINLVPNSAPEVQEIVTNEVPPTPSSEAPAPSEEADPDMEIYLSEDRKTIYAGTKVLKEIDNSKIFTFIQETWICDSGNIITEQEESFCTNQQTLRNNMEFYEIYISPDSHTVGFEISKIDGQHYQAAGAFSVESPDTQFEIFTGFDFGNKFLGFSPEGTYFAIQKDCWEAICDLYIKDSRSFEDVRVFKSQSDDNDIIEFVRWVDDGRIEYEQGIKPKEMTESKIVEIK